MHPCLAVSRVRPSYWLDTQPAITALMNARRQVLDLDSQWHAPTMNLRRFAMRALCKPACQPAGMNRRYSHGAEPHEPMPGYRGR